MTNTDTQDEVRYELAGGVLYALGRLGVRDLERLAASVPRVPLELRMRAEAELTGEERSAYEWARMRAFEMIRHTTERDGLDLDPKRATCSAAGAADAVLGTLVQTRVDTATHHRLMSAWRAVASVHSRGTNLLHLATPPTAEPPSTASHQPAVTFEASAASQFSSITVRRDARLALYLGIASLFCFGVLTGVPAIVLGRRAQRGLALSPDSDAMVMATIGLSLGVISILGAALLLLLTIGKAGA